MIIRTQTIMLLAIYGFIPILSIRVDQIIIYSIHWISIHDASVYHYNDDDDD